ncbi:hypothetical protein SLS55_005936 [Diplodia seriata]|uniref:chitinase n=1 Tax=Diplodia seriata TaxID=420778 RepID=A0ABR3CCV5_9PEZI
MQPGLVRLSMEQCDQVHGFCGTTEDFCGDETVDRPSCSISGQKIDKVIGYYEAWSMTERTCNGMLPEEIPYGIYTHINFAFATIDLDTFEIKPGDDQTKSLMERIQSIKLLQPDVEIWIAVGGWTFNDANQPTATTFSDLASSEANQKAFIDSLLQMMNSYGFDGIDIDWEYPVDNDRNGRAEDFKNFVSFMKKLKSNMTGSGKTKGVSLTLPSSYWCKLPPLPSAKQFLIRPIDMQHFDIVALEAHVDWFNVMLYDLHGSWDIDNEWTGPFVNSHTNLTEIQTALDLLWRNDIKPEKVVFGMGFYGRSFTLTDPACSSPGCVVASGGNPGKCSGTTGVLLNPEIQDVIKEEGLTPTVDRTAAVKYIHWGSQWVSYDDEVTWRLKANLAKSQCISGVMVWAASQDDSSSTNAKALTKAVGREIMDMPDFTAQPVTSPVPKVVDLCRWSNCNEDCPAGFKEVPRDGTKLMMTDETACLGMNPHKFCCPSDTDQPTCTWRGFKNSGACQPGCNDGEVEVGTLSKGCSSKHQSACCTDNAATSAYGSCKWFGSAGVCAKAGEHAGCGDDYPHFVFAASAGYGGDQICSQGSKSFCCTEPPPSKFTKCDWYTKASRQLESDYVCESSCPEGYVRLGMQKGSCSFGWEAYCCKGEESEPLEPRDTDSFGNMQVEEFKTLLSKYMENPTCPANILRVDMHDFYHDTPSWKRSVVTEPLSSLYRRATDCTKDTWVRLIAWLVTLSSHQIAELQPFKDVYNDLFADSYDEALGWDSAIAVLDAHGYDSRAFWEDVFISPMGAGPAMRRMQAAEEALCELPASAAAKVRTSAPARAGNTTLAGRHINQWAEDELRPDFMTILEGIRDNHLSLHYARWQFFRAAADNINPGPFLEVAYWIGPTPGVQPTEDEESSLRLDAYRDSTHTDTDRWVVFHFHFNWDQDLLRNIDGRTYIGTSTIRMFHGQWAEYENQGYRVHNRARHGMNSRSAFDCPDSTSHWYIGRPAVDTTFLDRADRDFYDLVQAWGERLFNDGYAGRAGVSRIFTGGSRLANGDMDPDSPGTLLLPWDPSWPNSELDPSSISWRILGPSGDDEWIFLYNIDGPEGL